MRIAVLAWGSLVWDPRTLAIDGDFQPKGPRLPIEFSRISGDGRLTLVIDESCGAVCATYVTKSAHEDLGEAIENLRAREGMKTSRGVGFVVPASSRQSATAKDRHPLALSTIAAWVLTSGHDAAIWTALASNFQQKTSDAFSVKGAVRYLEQLDSSARVVALNYIRRASPEIQTPLRSAVNLRWPEGSSNTTIKP
jgi:hypothetical protein